jgi:hypothetical protein
LDLALLVAARLAQLHLRMALDWLALDFDLDAFHSGQPSQAWIGRIPALAKDLVSTGFAFSGSWAPLGLAPRGLSAVEAQGGFSSLAFWPVPGGSLGLALGLFHAIGGAEVRGAPTFALRLVSTLS